jgi:periplasmic copper chaperone A
MKAIHHAVALSAAALWLALGSVAWAQSSAPIEISHAWARATASNAKTGAAYLTIVNNGSGDDRLVAISGPVAAKAELHVSAMDNGVMKMRPLAAVDVKPGATAELKPGGMHIMLVGLAAPLKEGQSFPLALTFEKAGTIPVTVTVEKAGAMGMPDMKMPGMKM